MTAHGKGSQQLVEFLDLYPTLCDLAGLSKPSHLEGHSFAGLLMDPNAEHRDAACSEMRRGQYMGRSIRTAEFRYVEWRNAKDRVIARELYDHRKDPEESVSVIENPEYTGAVNAHEKLVLENYGSLK